LDCAADYLDSSGFTDLDREASRVVGKKGWPSGGNLGTLAALSFFDSAVVDAQSAQATVELGTSRAFFVVVGAVFAVSMAGLWWIPPAQRAVGGLVLAGATYAVATLLALTRARIAFTFIANRCAKDC